MNQGDTSTVVTVADRLGVPVLVLLLIAIGLWKAGPRVGAFLTALTEELKTMTRAIGQQSEKHVEHHVATMERIEHLGRHFDDRTDTLEARLREHGQIIAGAIGQEVRASVEQTGQHIAVAFETMTRQPTNPEMRALVEERISPIPGDRQSPTPGGYVRQVSAGKGSRPALPGRDPSRPSWETTCPDSLPGRRHQ